MRPHQAELLIVLMVFVRFMVNGVSSASPPNGGPYSPHPSTSGAFSGHKPYVIVSGHARAPPIARRKIIGR